MDTTKSKSAFDQALRVLVGGVNSPVRAFQAVGGTPLTIASAKGAHLRDVDGNDYIDYVGGYGPMILGHAHPAVVEAICQAAGRGGCYGAPTLAETELAEMIVAAMPAVEKLRFVSSGTEAVMSALRLARGATGRTRVLKCTGCYHGHSDALLVAAGSGATTLGVPSSAGVPEAVVRETIPVPYNDAAVVDAALQANAGHVAAVIVEPVAANMGLVLPAPDYLQALRMLCTKHGVLLIFDEVITGFRVGFGGAQGMAGVVPDLTILGKIIGGGLPVGAYGGRADIMRHLSPEGPVYQAGTLSGNGIAMAAGIATLKLLRAGGAELYIALAQLTQRLEEGFIKAADAAGLAGRVTFTRLGSLMCCFFAPPPVTNYATATAADTKAFAAYFHGLLDGGVNLAPAQFEAMFLSTAHTASDIDRTIEAASKAFKAAAEVMGA
jgi:glutamate-1-semialdehyde 2,1-aminomutase